MEVVSFEISKKLKEKGFREKTLSMYLESVKLPHIPLIYSLKDWNKEDNCYSAPTISQVLKWLREEKKIHISPCCYKDDNISFAGWFYLIIEMRDSIWKYHDQEPQQDNSTATYESVAIDAIKYVLDNLI